jgi:hypothetical protein
MRSGCDPGCSKRSPDALRDALCRYPGSASKHRSLRPTLAVAACAPRLISRAITSRVRLPIPEAVDYMTSIGKKRELRTHWQRVAKLALAKEDVLTVSRALELALFMDAKLDVSKIGGT